jgi:hypothetical protein
MHPTVEVYGPRIIAVLAERGYAPAEVGYRVEVMLAGAVTRADVARQLRAAIDHGTGRLDARAHAALLQSLALPANALTGPLS